MHARSRRARAELSGQQVAHALNPSHSKPSLLRNHHRDNVRQLRETERLNRERRLEKENARPVTAFKLDRFQHVQARVAPDPVPRKQHTGPAHTFLKKGVRRSASAAVLRGRPQSAASRSSFSPASALASRPSTSSKAPGKAAATGTLRRRKAATDTGLYAPPPMRDPAEAVHDFVRSNARELRGAQPPVQALSPSASATAVTQALATGDTKHAAFGRVPAYLRRRQDELQAVRDERRREKERRRLPPGMQKMPEAERVATVETLRRNLQALESELGRGPLRVETTGQRRRRAELEQKVREIEEAITMFDRKVVYVRIDERADFGDDDYDGDVEANAQVNAAFRRDERGAVDVRQQQQRGTAPSASGPPRTRKATTTAAADVGNVDAAYEAYGDEAYSFGHSSEGGADNDDYKHDDDEDGDYDDDDEAW